MENIDWKRIVLFAIMGFLIISLAYFASTGDARAFLATWKLV